jgi:Spy/CpxP family protein refolding chaperone
MCAPFRELEDMNRKTCLLVAGLFSSVFALGQVQPARPPMVRPQPPAEPAGPQGEQKLRWICRQLKLDEKQMQQAEALVAAYQAELKDAEANAAELLQKIQDKAAEMQAARNAGDTEGAKRLQEELRKLAPPAQAESHFFEALEPVLNAEQKAKLPAIRKRAETAGDVSLRPVYVLRAARKLALTDQQNQQLEKLLEDYRTAASAARNEKGEAAEERVEQFIKNVRSILAGPQVEAYDKEIAALHENPPTATPFQPPPQAPSGVTPATTQPAEPPSPAAPPPSPRPHGK